MDEKQEYDGTLNWNCGKDELFLARTQYRYDIAFPNFTLF
jgi:hypothetical protein